MKNLLLAAALAFVPTASQAAVTINFSGGTFPYVKGSALIGSSKEVETPSYVTTEIETESRTVSGTIVIDTGSAGMDLDSGPGVFYSGDSFVTLTFASDGYTPTKLTGTLSQQQIDNAALSGLTFQLFDQADTYGYQFQLYSLNNIPTSIFDGLLLPDFTMANGLFFAAASVQVQGDTTVRYLSAGAVKSISQVAAAVPEPATWAMMLVGFGLVGVGLRRRERVSVRFA